MAPAPMLDRISEDVHACHVCTFNNFDAFLTSFLSSLRWQRLDELSKSV